MRDPEASARTPWWYNVSQLTRRGQVELEETGDYKGIAPRTAWSLSATASH